MSFRVFVKAAPERLVPLHATSASGAGGALVMCKPGNVYPVEYTTEVRKRIKSGDLALCDRDGKDVPEERSAAVPDGEIELDAGGALVKPALADGPELAKFDVSDTKAAKPTKES